MIDGKTGVFFHEQSPKSLAEAVERCESLRFDSSAIRENALRFSFEQFERRFRDFVESAHTEYEETFFA